MTHSWKGQGVGRRRRRKVALLGKKRGETGKPLPHPKKLSHLEKNGTKYWFLWKFDSTNVTENI